MADFMKALVRWLIPLPLRRLLKRLWLGARYVPAVGAVRFGDLRRVTPICRDFGQTRGLAVDRHYVEGFLDAHRQDIRGRVLEIGDSVYTLQFGDDRVTHADVLHAVAGNPKATIVGDLQTGENVPIGQYDCMILTQALNVIYDCKGVLCHSIRALKPGGVLLMTVPGITQISLLDVERGWGDHWRFTPHSVRRMLEEVVPKEAIAVCEYGNVLAATSFLQGLCREELTREELDYFDPEFTMIIGARVAQVA